MYEHVGVVGERGQITIPKAIRKIRGIRPKDKVVVKLEGGKIVVEKDMTRKEKGKLMKEYFHKYGKLNKEIEEEWKHASSEANRYLDER